MPSAAQCQCKDDSVIICSLQDVMQFKIHRNIFGIIRTRCLDAREKKQGASQGKPLRVPRSCPASDHTHVRTHTHAHTHMYNTWDEILLSS